MKTNQKEAGITEGRPPCPPLAPLPPCHVNRVAPAPLRAGCLAAALAAALLLLAPVAHAQYTANYQTNIYDGAAASTNWGGNYMVGSNFNHDVLQVLNGAGLTNAIGYVGYTANVANDNLVVVSGSGSIWNNTGGLNIGVDGARNQLIITNGGLVVGASAIIGGSFGSSKSNLVVVTGNGSVWSNAANLIVGYGAIGNQLTIADGGRVVNVDGNMGFLAAANGGVVLVSGSNSLWNNTSNLYVGYAAVTGNQLIITNSGSVSALSVRVGKVAGANGNTVRIESGGLLDANTLVVAVAGSGGGAGSVGNSITNFGGIFQFSTATPTITTNAVGALPVNNAIGSIVLTNGTIAFRNITNANVKANWSGSQLTNITFQGDNTFRLNTASNGASGQDYVFDTNLGATNYVGLEMIHGVTAWRGGSLTIGGGGAMLVSNTTASVAGLFSNQGTVRVVNSTVTWQSNVVIGGRYVSDPSTNIFTTNVMVTASGSLSGSNGDLFVFHRDFINQSTNRTDFNLAFASVLFTNATSHILNLTNSGAVDMGSNWLNVAQLATNFSIGSLAIASSDNLTVTGARSGGTTNALYVGWLDLQGAITNDYTTLTNSLFAALTLPDINLYYDAGDARNAYLNDQSYDLWGGGLLIPIPEPSALMLTLAAGALSMFILRRKRNEKCEVRIEKRQEGIPVRL